MAKKEMMIKKHVRKWVRRAGIWLYLKYETGKQHISRIRQERSHDAVQIHSAYVRIYSNTEQRIMLTIDMTHNFIANWKCRGMYMRSPHKASGGDGVFMKWRKEHTISNINRHETLNVPENSLWLKVEYSMKEEEDKYAAVYIIHPKTTPAERYYYFPPYSASKTEPGDYWLGPSCGTEISTFHKWPDTWMQAESNLMKDEQKKTS